MAMKMKQTEHYQNEFSAVWPDLPGYKTSWIDHLRLSAINGFSKDGFPFPRAEDWKYTGLEELIETPFSVLEQKPPTLDEQRIEQTLREIDSAADLVFINGHYSVAWSSMNLEGQATISPLGFALRQNPSEVKERLTSYPETLTAFESLNAAFMRDGVCLNVHQNVSLTKPIQILYVVTAEKQPQNLNTRNVLLFSQNSKTTLIERTLQLGESAQQLNNIVSQIEIENNAELSHFKVVDEGPLSYHLAVNRVHQQRDSRYAHHYFALGGLLSRNNLKVELAGEGASCQVNGLLMVDGQRQTDLYTDVEHQVPHCSSQEEVKAILNDQAKGVFRGKIKVFEKAQKTDAQLHNANLLLSREAEINTMPQLEIFADDVKCSHGSSSGQLDSNQLFYLKSRGLDVEAARNLLVFAFANSIINLSPEKQINKILRNGLLSKLPAGSAIEELIQ